MKEKLKLVLEALLHAYHEDEAHPKTLEAITTIKEILAQPEQDGVCSECKMPYCECDEYE